MRTRVREKLGAFSFGASSDRFVGSVQVLLSTIGFGAIGTFAKFAYASGINSPTLLALRFIVASAALWSYFLLFKREAIRVSLRQIAICAALGLAGYGVFSSLAFKAFESTPASIVGLLFFSYPVFVALLDWLTTRERPGSQLLLGALVIACGIMVGVAGSIAEGLGVGLLFAVAGGFWYAAYVVTVRRLLNGLKPRTIVLYVTSFAALGFWFMGGPVLTQARLMPASAWLLVLSIALISTVGALLTFFSGLEKLGSAEASQIGTFELIVSLTLTTVVLGEHIGAPLMLGAGLVLVGMITGQMKSGVRHERCPD